MKKVIQEWLGISRCDHKCECPKVKADVEDIIKRYWSIECSQCHKVMLAHDGGQYRNFEGRIFCSHKCIDETKV